MAAPSKERSPASACQPSSAIAAPPTAARSTGRRLGKYHSAKLLRPWVKACEMSAMEVTSSASGASVQV